jgi:MerR family redox-sensitive transcriptional activator SoxR
LRSGNQRPYRGDVPCRIAMIRVCQQAGLTLTQIRAVLAEALPDGQIPAPRNWELLARHLRREPETRIHDLNRFLGALGPQLQSPAAPA